MSDSVLETIALCKEFNGHTALRDVSLTIKRGKIYGLIGQNGAGKTTLMRLVAGLQFASRGEIRLFGQQGAAALQRARKRVGFMIEAPSINASMTAHENIALHRTIKGIPNEEWDAQILDQVGLKDAGRKKARHFSLGMKQRLGIALSLIGRPELLVLDEPINGLDPIGVVEIRQLLQSLCEERDLAILLSSHNLPELFQTATDYIIIDHGEIRKVMTHKELVDQCKSFLLIRCDNTALAVSLIENALGTKDFLVMPDHSIRLYGCDDRVEEAAALFKSNDLLVTNLSIEGTTLENYYLQIVRGEENV